MDMMELDGLAGVDALFGISGLKEDLMDVGVGALSAGVAALAVNKGLPMIPWVRDQSGYVKAGLLVATGAAAGIGIGRLGYRAVGAGVAFGIAGQGIAMAAAKLMGMTPGYLNLSGADGGDYLLGADYLGGTQNMDYTPLPGQVRGLGQAGAVSTRDLQSMPGQGSSGFAGFASVLG